MESIDNSHNILITTHVSPDGDAIGSSLALYNFIKNPPSIGRLYPQKGGLKLILYYKFIYFASPR